MTDALHKENCASIEQLAHELNESRNAERLLRMQFAAVLEERDIFASKANHAQQDAIRLNAQLAALQEVARKIEPFASGQACDRREMKIYDACREMRSMIYDVPVMTADDWRKTLFSSPNASGQPHPTERGKSL